MMKSVRNLFVLALGSLAVLAACDSYEREEVTREIYVNKHEITLTVGQSDTLVVSPAAGQAQWHSEAEDIATVDADGVVKAVAAGSTSIVVTKNGAKFTVGVTVVNNIPLTDVVLSAPKLLGSYAVSLIPGATQKVLVSTVPGNANNVSRGDYAWWSDNDAVAHVYDDGTISAVAEGSTTVHYRRGTITKSVNVYVSKTSPFKGPHVLKKATPLELSFLDFDFGGPEVAWHDATPKNQGGSNYRADNGDDNSGGVDIEGSSNIGYTANGEWLVYTIDVQDGGVYSLELCVSGNGGTMHYEVDGADATGTINVIGTGGWGDYRYNTVSTRDLRLTAGRHKVKVVFDNAAFNVKAMKFTYVDDL